jgi:hypothetical protein
MLTRHQLSEFYSFLVGFFKVDCLDLAFPRRRFAWNCEEETAAAASGAALRPDLYPFFSLFLPGDGRRGCGRSGTIDNVRNNPLTINRRCEPSGTISRGCEGS